MIRSTLEQPLVSVIIPTYNRAYCIERTINSVFRQTYLNWELIIIDSSPDESTLRIITSYLTDSRIKYIFLKNLNSSEALNYGIKLSQGDYIALLDDDDEFIENKLALQLSEMLKHNADFSLSNCIKVYDGKKEIPRSCPKTYIINMKDFFRERFHLSHTHMMFKSSIKKYCWFDPSIPASDDFDLIMRIINKKRILFIKEPLSYIHKSAKRKRISNNPQMKIQSLEQLIKKTMLYSLTDVEKQRLINNLTLRLGFWQMMDKKYKLGRESMSEKMAYLPFIKRGKYLTLYLLSYVPPLFESLKLIVEYFWRLSAGRIKV